VKGELVNMKVEPSPLNKEFETLALIEKDQSVPGRLDWWYRLAAPPVPPATATLKEREAYRRGRYISNTLLALLSLLSLIIVVIGGFVQHGLLPNLTATLALLCGAVYFNKRGLDVSIMLTFLGFGQMSAFLLPLFDLLVIPLLFAAAMLPPMFVFLDAGFHTLYYVLALTVLFPKDAELTALLSNPAHFIDALARPVAIQGFAAIIAYTLMRSLLRSVQRADRATSIAVLERNMAEQAQREVEQKQRLEQEIQEIIAVHAQIAHGRMTARVPLREGYMLLPIAISLNNLLTRFQSLLREAQKLKVTDEAIAAFFNARQSTGDGFIPWMPTRTYVDVLVQQHNTFAHLHQQEKVARTTEHRPGG
jgi:hypothetical protein